MNAALAVRIEDGKLVELRTAAPLGAKARRHDWGFELTLVGTAASLIEGDRLCVDISVGDGQHLVVRSVAAQMALVCAAGRSTGLRIHARVGAGAVLDWAPQPLVLCSGARHRSETVLDVDASGQVCWVDEVVLGRTAETPAAVALYSTLYAHVDSLAVLRDGLDTTRPGWNGPAVAGDARYLGSVIGLGRYLDAPLPRGTFALAGPGVLFRHLDRDTVAGRCSLSLAASALREAFGCGSQSQQR